NYFQACNSAWPLRRTPPPSRRSDPTISLFLDHQRNADRRSLAEHSGIARVEVRIDEAQLREAREDLLQSHLHDEACEAVAEAMVRPGAECRDVLGIARDVEPQRIWISRRVEARSLHADVDRRAFG